LIVFNYENKNYASYERLTVKSKHAVVLFLFFFEVIYTDATDGQPCAHIHRFSSTHILLLVSIRKKQRDHALNE